MTQEHVELDNRYRYAATRWRAGRYSPNRAEWNVRCSLIAAWRRVQDGFGVEVRWREWGRKGSWKRHAGMMSL